MTTPALRVLDGVLEPLARRIQPGRVVELSGGPGCARTTTAVSILHRMQTEGETAAWIQPQGGGLYPPDLHDAGIDLDALVVVHVPSKPYVHGACKAAELLLRSGAFGLVVVDFIDATPSPPLVAAWLGRTLGLARQHESLVVLLTDTPAHADSVGTLVGLRIESRRHRDPSGDFVVEHRVLKNKSGAPFEVPGDRHRGTEGMP